MGTFSYVGNAVASLRPPLETSLEVVSDIVNHTEPLEKVTKIAERSIRGVEIVCGGVSEAVSRFGEQLVNASLMFDTLKFFGNAKNVMCPDENGKYLLTNPANSWQKCADRVTLAIHSTFKFVKGLNKFGFVSLGFMAKNAIGTLPIFQLVMDSFIIASNVFGFWDSVALALPKANKKLKEANEKIDKWQQRAYSIELIKAGDRLELQTFQERYEAKATALSRQLQKLEAADSKGLAQIESTKAKLHRVNERIAKIASDDFTGLAADLEKTDISLKEKQWEVIKYNAQQECTKVWIKIANAICKISVVTFALILIATNVWTAPYALSLIALGNLTDVIGVTKIELDAFWKPKAIPVA